MRLRPHTIPIALLFAVGVLWAGGCGQKNKYAKVNGVVTMNGKPIRWVEVVFMPDPEKGHDGPSATAYTDENGRYSLETQQTSRPGALIGLHRVCIRDLTALNLDVVPGSDGVGGAAGKRQRFQRTRPLVAFAYADPFKTPLRDVEVKEGTQTLDFAVTSEPGTAPK